MDPETTTTAGEAGIATIATTIGTVTAGIGTTTGTIAATIVTTTGIIAATTDTIGIASVLSS